MKCGMRGMPRIWRPIRRGRGSRPANAPACESRVLEGRAGWSIRSAYARGGAGRCQYGGALRLSGQHRLARIRGCQCASTSGRPGITGDGDRRRHRGLAREPEPGVRAGSGLFHHPVFRSRLYVIHSQCLFLHAIYYF